jgi:hypothetical protein
MADAASAESNEKGESGHEELKSALISNPTTEQEDAEELRRRPWWRLRPTGGIRATVTEDDAEFERRSCKSDCCKPKGAHHCPVVRKRDTASPEGNPTRRQKRCPLNPPTCQAIAALGIMPESDINIAAWESIGAFANAAGAQNAPRSIPAALDSSLKEFVENAPPPAFPPKTITHKPKQPKPPRALENLLYTTSSKVGATNTLDNGVNYIFFPPPLTDNTSNDGIEKAETIVNQHLAPASSVVKRDCLRITRRC